MEAMTLFEEFDAFGDELDAIFAGKVDATRFGSKNGVCRYNSSVMCDKADCYGCGWNPTVDKARRAATRERLLKEGCFGKPE